MASLVQFHVVARTGPVVVIAQQMRGGGRHSTLEKERESDEPCGAPVAIPNGWIHAMYRCAHTASNTDFEIGSKTSARSNSIFRLEHNRSSRYSQSSARGGRYGPTVTDVLRISPGSRRPRWPHRPPRRRASAGSRSACRYTPVNPIPRIPRPRRSRLPSLPSATERTGLPAGCSTGGSSREPDRCGAHVCGPP